ncbi:High-affinity glucose transporter [Penicillium argentinense]|uniref:High-affinity glucose transporter n=1 Tax=Penicillium argentinense TaxID=1131581 RepID=A0A9W9G179_9EURO|nr:High-affinity glucose transporter [Penicillium argentinense]KAJ5110259.1 High-affinity glucose transporter [Penicillium argentinense]
MVYTIGNIYIITTVAVIGGALFGFDIASMSAMVGDFFKVSLLTARRLSLGTQQYRCFFNQTGTNEEGSCGGPTSSTQGGISAAMPGGSFVGALISGIVTDWLGRKHAIQVGSVIWCIGSAISCASFSIAQLVVGRFINGLSVGILSAQVPVYVAELAQPSKRGTVVGAQQWAITWGILIMFYVSYGSSFLEGPSAWRLPWGLQMVPAVFLFFMIFIMPESPRWLAKHDRWEEAHDVLARVHAKGNHNDAFVQTELQEIREMVEFERQNTDASYLDLFKPNMIYRTHIGMFTQIWSQLTGMNVMMLYITYVFGMAGLSGNANLVASSIQYMGPSTPTPHRLNAHDDLDVCQRGDHGLVRQARTPGGLNNTREQSWDLSDAPAAAKGVIACTYLFVASFAPTWGPVSWIYPPELYPLRLRGKAVAVSTASNWIFNFALSYFVPPAFENIKWKVYLVFGVFCFTMTVHVFFAFPETAGKTLEDVDHMFNTPGLKPWKTKVQFQHVRQLETGAIQSEKLAAFHEERAQSVDKEAAGATKAEQV